MGPDEVLEPISKKRLGLLVRHEAVKTRSPAVGGMSPKSCFVTPPGALRFSLRWVLLKLRK